MLTHYGFFVKCTVILMFFDSLQQILVAWMAADSHKQNIAVRANAWQQRADKQFEKQPVLAFSGRHYQHLGHHEVLALSITAA